MTTNSRVNRPIAWISPSVNDKRRGPLALTDSLGPARLVGRGVGGTPPGVKRGDAPGTDGGGMGDISKEDNGGRRGGRGGAVTGCGGVAFGKLTLRR